MTDAKSAWNDTGEQLTELGSKLGAHFDQQRGTDGTNAREQASEAFKRLGEAIKDSFEAVGAAARDDAVKQDVKQVGRSFVGALDVTFREVSDRVGKAFDRSPGGSPTEPSSPGAPVPPSPSDSEPRPPREPGDPTPT